MTVSVGRIVLVEYPGVIPGAKPGIVTDVAAYNNIDVTVFGASEVRSGFVREFRGVTFADGRTEVQGPFAYYPPRVEDPKPASDEPKSPPTPEPVSIGLTYGQTGGE